MIRLRNKTNDKQPRVTNDQMVWRSHSSFLRQRSHLFLLVRALERKLCGIGKGSICSPGCSCSSVELRRSREGSCSCVSAARSFSRPLPLHDAEGQSGGEREDLAGSSMARFAVASTIGATVVVVITIGRV